MTSAREHEIACSRTIVRYTEHFSGPSFPACYTDNAEHWNRQGRTCARSVVRPGRGIAAATPERAVRLCELAAWVDDELGALEGGHTRRVPLDDRGMFPGTSVLRPDVLRRQRQEE